MHHPDASTTVLFKTYHKYVAAFLNKVGVCNSALDDAVQEVFLVVHRMGGYRTGAAAPRTWLSHVAVRVASNVRRGQRRRISREAPQSQNLDRHAGLGNPETSLLQQDALREAEIALYALSEEQRHLIIQFNVLGHSCDEIANNQNIPIGTVYSRLHTARKSLRVA